MGEGLEGQSPGMECRRLHDDAFEGSSAAINGRTDGRADKSSLLRGGSNTHTHTQTDKGRFCTFQKELLSQEGAYQPPFQSSSALMFPFSLSLALSLSFARCLLVCISVSLTERSGHFPNCPSPHLVRSRERERGRVSER